MTARIAVYCKKYKKIFPETGNIPGIYMQNANFTDFWITDIIIVTSMWCITQNLILLDSI